MPEKIISYSVTEIEYEKIKTNALSEGMSVTIYCKEMALSEKPKKFVKNTNIGAYYSILLDKVEKLPHSLGYKFTIQQLLEDEDWYQKATIYIKQALGRQFYSMVLNQKISGVKLSGEYKIGKSLCYIKK
jgi:hypothetical protein